MNLTRTLDILTLHITPDYSIEFRQSWVEELRMLPYDRYGEFIRAHIYPALSEQEKWVWNRVSVSNKELREALEGLER